MTPWNLIDGANVLYLAFAHSGSLEHSLKCCTPNLSHGKSALYPWNVKYNSSTCGAKSALVQEYLQFRPTWPLILQPRQGVTSVIPKTHPFKSIPIRPPRKIRNFFRDIYGKAHSVQGLGYGLDDPEFDSRKGKRFYFSPKVKTDLGSAQSLIQWTS